MSATYTTADGNAGSLTHWARPGNEPATSWFPVGFANHWATMGTPRLSFLKKFFFYYSWGTMSCQFLLYSQVPQLHMHIHIHTYIFFFSYSCHGLSQETGHGSLCCTVGPHCLSIPVVIVCIYKPQIPSPSTSSPLPPGNHKSFLHVHESVL